MDIFADGKSFAIAMMMTGVEYQWNKDDNSLSLWSKKLRAYPLSITTNRGTFVEAIDESGAIVGSGGDGKWCYVHVGEKPVRLRYKTLPKPTLSKSALNKHRKTVTRYLIDGSPYSDEVALPDTITGLVAWSEKLLAQIPKARRSKASFRFDTSSSYGESYPHVEVTYEEPETDEEVVTRLQIEAERTRITEAAERAQLDQLAAKY